MIWMQVASTPQNDTDVILVWIFDEMCVWILGEMCVYIMYLYVMIRM